MIDRKLFPLVRIIGKYQLCKNLYHVPDVLFSDVFGQTANYDSVVGGRVDDKVALIIELLLLVAQALKNTNAEYCKGKNEAQLFFQAGCWVLLVQEWECIEKIVMTFSIVQTVACGLVIEETEGRVDYDKTEDKEESIFNEPKK